MKPSSVHDTSNSLRSSGNNGGSASCRKCDTACARLTTPMTRASRRSDCAGFAPVVFTLTVSFKLLLLQNFVYEFPDGDDLFDHRRMLDRIHVPFDIPAARAQRVSRMLGPAELHDLIVRAVRHEDRYVTIRVTRFGDNAIGCDEIRREPDHAREPLGMANARIQGDCTALREAGKDDARSGDAARLLARD